MNKAQIIMTLVAMTCFIGGVLIGTFIQQQIMIKAGYEFARGLEGTEIEINIDLNETAIVEGMAEIFGEALNETGNTS